MLSTLSISEQTDFSFGPTDWNTPPLVFIPLTQAGFKAYVDLFRKLLESDFGPHERWEKSDPSYLGWCVFHVDDFPISVSLKWIDGIIFVEATHHNRAQDQRYWSDMYLQISETVVDGVPACRYCITDNRGQKSRSSNSALVFEGGRILFLDSKDQPITSQDFYLPIFDDLAEDNRLAVWDPRGGFSLPEDAWQSILADSSRSREPGFQYKAFLAARNIPFLHTDEGISIL